MRRITILGLTTSLVIALSPHVARASMDSTPWNFYYAVQSLKNSKGKAVPTKINFYVSAYQGATLKVTDPAGKTLLSSTLAPSYDEQALSFTTTSTAVTAEYRATLITESGFSETYPMIVANAWGLMLPDETSVFPKCSTVYWSYDHSKAPKTASALVMLKDIRQAFARVSTVSGLNFVELSDSTQKPESNIISIDWDYKRAQGGDSAAYGGPTVTNTGATGSISINPKSSLTRSDATAGFGRLKTGGGARGWLMIHEILHALGLDHSYDRTQVMYPTIWPYKNFGKADLAGINYLYEPMSCKKS